MRMKTIGERLREQRERLRMTQVAFADAGGVQKLAQIKYEKGERVPSAEYLARLAGVGVDVAYVITGMSSRTRNRLSAVREATDIAATLHLPEANTLAAQEVIFKRLIAEQDAAENALASTRLAAPLTPREAALLDNYRNSPEEARAALDKTSAALAQSRTLTPQARTRKHKAQGG